MPEITPRLGLKKPLSNETVTRSAYNENLDIMDQNAVKISDLAAHLVDLTAHATKAALALYVDDALGDDANIGLAAGAGFALKTIQAAVNKIPKIINHGITINVAAGTYNEVVVINGFTGEGYIKINGGSSLATAVNFKVYQFQVIRNTSFIWLMGFKANRDNGSYGGFYCVNNAGFVELDYCIDDTVSSNGFNVTSGNYYMLNCLASNHNNYAVFAQNCLLDIFDCYGSGNNVGVYANHGAFVNIAGAYAFGKRIRGTNNTYTQSGGQIFPKETGVDVTLYVRTDGSDDNDGSTDDSAHALRTIQEAIRRLPPIINHTVIIEVSNTGVYAEDINVSGFIGKGAIHIIGGTSLVTAVNYVVNWINIFQNSLEVQVKGFTSTKVGSHGVNIARHNGYFFGQYLRCVGADSTYAGFSAAYSHSVRVQDSDFSSRAKGIYAAQAHIYSSTNGGTGNTIGIYADSGGVIAKYNTQPGGTTAEGTQTGGVIR